MRTFTSCFRTFANGKERVVLFENIRMTKEARNVVRLMSEEAKSLRRQYLGVEQVMLALLREENGDAHTILLSEGVTYQKMRDAATFIFQIGEYNTKDHQLSAKTQQVFSLAARKANEPPGEEVDTQHILYALLNFPEGTQVTGLLQSAGVDIPKLKKHVDDVLSTPEGFLSKEEYNTLNTSIAKIPIIQLVLLDQNKIKPAILIQANAELFSEAFLAKVIGNTYGLNYFKKGVRTRLREYWLTLDSCPDTATILLMSQHLIPPTEHVRINCGLCRSLYTELYNNKGALS